MQRPTVPAKSCVASSRPDVLVSGVLRGPRRGHNTRRGGSERRPKPPDAETYRTGAHSITAGDFKEFFLECSQLFQNYEENPFGGISISLEKQGLKTNRNKLNRFRADEINY